MDYPGKLIRNTPLVPTLTSASGVWTMTEAMDAVKANSWPVAGTPLPMQQSLRFRNSATAYMTRTVATASNRQKFTLSYWVKPGIISSGSINPIIFSAGNASTRPTATLGCFLAQASNNAYNLQSYNGTGYDYNFTTTQVFRDPSAWYHFVVAFDTTQATDTNRVKLYVNGSQVTAFSTASYPSQNLQLAINNNVTHGISTNTYNPGSNGDALDGYLAEMNFIDGQQLTPSSFGQTDPQTGVWQPIPYTGTYGGNGFYLPFKNTLNLGQDYSGNANNWTAANFSTTPTYNYTSYTSGSGTYTVPAGVSSINYLVVAGGGGAGGNAFNGGGGAGGVLMGTLAVTPGQTLAYSVGAGGAGGSGGTNGANGSNSSLGGLTAIGGGAGGSTANGAGASGGSGGGGAGGSSGTGTAGAGTAGQGFAGGTGYGAGSGLWGAGGGGGAGTAGVNGSSGQGGNGGSGRTWINGTTYGGGGGGATGVGNTAGTGGSGGGGAGSNSSSGTSGTANTGGGGGGASGNNTGGSGGSGIVIVAYQTSASTYDVMADTPTQWLPQSTLNGNPNARGNYATFNPAVPVGATGTGTYTLTNGNLNYSFNGGTQAFAWNPATIGVTSGKWYWEATPTSSNVNINVGWMSGNTGFRDDVTTPSFYAAYYSCTTSPVQGFDSTSGSISGTALQVANGDIIGIAFDYDAGSITFYKNGTSMGSITGMTTGGVLLYPYLRIGSYGRGAATSAANFGQRPFAYTPPSGYLPLNTYNLSTPTIGATASTQANKYMDATLYTGNGTGLSVTNAGSFKPDLVWTKARSSAYTNNLIDSVRGASISLVSNSTAAEDNGGGTYFVTAFNSNGFTVGIGTGSNNNGTTYVGWQWQAGQGTNISNTSGSITSTVSVNATAGFSIVTYTGNNSSATVGHGLGATPAMIITKVRSTTNGWVSWHTSLGGANKYIVLSNTSTTQTDTTTWNNTLPTSSVFSLGANVNTNVSGATYVAYCWSAVAGFSAFGSYTGNGSTDGPFIYTGFRPKFILVKRTDSADDWAIYDSSRDTYNQATKQLRPNAATAELDPAGVPAVYYDLLSNGFKNRGSNSQCNANGGTYIYAAFAESPFKYSLAR